MIKRLTVIALLLLCACGSNKKVVTSKHKKPAVVATHKEIKVVPTKEVVKEVEKVVVVTKKSAKSKLNSTTLTYVKQYAPLAIEEMRKFNIPASITLAQGILESGSGRSELSSKSNNHFGIKCHKGWKGGRVYHDDDAKGECFRKYTYPATSYQDHSLFLTTRFRYASLFKLKKDDYKGWAKGLKKAGYATDPKYPNKLISYIEKYKLYKYDELVLKGKVNTAEMTQKVEVKEVVQELKDETKRRKKINRKGVHTVDDDDTLYGISRQYEISVEELKALNNLTDNTIHEGDELKLRSDANRKNYHLVKPKETLYAISKKYDVTVKELKRLNQLKGNELSIGQELRVK
ncbi:glucosaminidase domain-containing protein [Wenyingzhuangia sp. IMCC45533]